ncbi:carboxypeptidase-like regulatory domain-containing protein [Hymenobacter sp. UYP22]|uniref:carboxypeptidase-like regulatory domain-containing protein n=1 Tax=Hymenobacter sp. UYP22 TaxID=3156348 RepID=UPI0033924314
MNAITSGIAPKTDADYAMVAAKGLCLLLTVVLGSCVSSSYERWHALAPGRGTYRIEREEFRPDKNQAGGTFRLQIEEEINQLPLDGGVTVAVLDSLHQVVINTNAPATGKLTLPVAPGRYTVRFTSIGFHSLETKPLFVRKSHILFLRVYLGAEY